MSSSSENSVLVKSCNVEKTNDVVSVPIYFAVSPLKFCVMSIFTWGFYDLYWFYKNWILARDRENLNISPILRAFFAYFFCYNLLKRVYVLAKKSGVKKLFFPSLSTVGWVIISLLAGLSYLPYFFISLSAFMFLLPVQITMNNVNKTLAPNCAKNNKFTGWNIFGIVLGGISLFILILEMIVRQDNMMLY